MYVQLRANNHSRHRWMRQLKICPKRKCHLYPIQTLSLINLTRSLFLQRQKQLEFRRQFFFRVKSVTEINPSQPTVSVQLHPQCFNIISAISPSCKVAQIELNLIPSFVKSHRHGANERFYPGSALVVRSAEPPPNVFIVQYLHLEREVFFQVFDDHH